MFPYFDFSGPVGLAHRGYAKEVPENSIRAFQNAVDLGYKYLETDVHSTNDGTAVIFHDDSMLRMLGIEGQIRDISFAQLQETLLNGTDPVPTLAETLETFPEQFFNIDIKTPQAIVPFVETIEKLKCHDRICVASFSDTRRRQVVQMLSKPVATSQGMMGSIAFKAASYAPWPYFAKRASRSFDALNVPGDFKGRTFTNERLVKAADQAGMKVFVWTINDRTTMEQLVDMGVDGIFTDEAELLKDVLGF